MKQKTKTQAWYRKKCVSNAKQTALERDRYCCVKCGRSKLSGWAIHASHIFPEGKYHGMSANPENIIALCYQCHMQWWHKDIISAKDWFANKFPQRLEYLKSLSRIIIKTDWKKEYEKKKT